MRFVVSLSFFLYQKRCPGVTNEMKEGVKAGRWCYISYIWEKERTKLQGI